MHIYTVFLPSSTSSAPGADEAVFVRQGFNWSAFLFTPLWALRRGYWLALALWLAWVCRSSLCWPHMPISTWARRSLFIRFGAFAFGLEADRFREAQRVAQWLAFTWSDAWQFIGRCRKPLFSAVIWRRSSPTVGIRPLDRRHYPKRDRICQIGRPKPTYWGCFRRGGLKSERRHHRLRIRQSAFGRQGFRARRS